MSRDLREIPTDKVQPNPDQPRKTFDIEALNELARSIKRDGLLQPITVRPLAKGRFEIVAGERRWRAHGLLKLPTILCHVRKVDDLARDIAAIVENLQRVDVSPLETAAAFGRLVDIGLAPDEIATRVGTSAARVRQRLLLLNLEPSIAKLLASGHLQTDAASEIARLSKFSDQLKIVQMINRGKITMAPGSRGDSIRNAVNLVLGMDDNVDMFGASAAPLSNSEIQALTRMERKIEDVVRMVSGGWKNGECVIANRVNPDRAKLMAEKLLLIRNAIRSMERELRAVTARAVVQMEIK